MWKDNLIEYEIHLKNINDYLNNINCYGAKIKRIINRDIPMKPYADCGCSVYYCNNCDVELLESGRGRNQQFCSCCGQALDWSKEDES